MRSRRLLLLAIPLLVLLGMQLPAETVADPDPARFAQAIAAIRERESTSPSPAGSIVFLGSSSIRRWPLAEAFPGLPVVNNGFGGSQWSDVRAHIDAVVLPPAPRAWVLYCGENDLWSGKSVMRVMADLEVVLHELRKAAPEARIIVIGIKPSPSRMSAWERMQAYNEACAERLARLPNSTFVHPVEEFQDAAGAPREDLFVGDRLHLNAQGYQPWERALRPIFEELLRE